MRTSDEYDADGGLLLIGSDVGGMAWSPYHNPEVEPSVWHTANGTLTDWNDGTETSVMELAATWRGDRQGGRPGFRDPAEFDVYALTGTDALGYGGGLWWTSDLEGNPQFWRAIAPELSAFKHRDDCVTTEETEDTAAPAEETGSKDISSGDLMVDFPDYPSHMLIGSGGRGTAAARRGLYLWEKNTTSPPVEPYIGLPENATYSALPAALATGEVDDVPFVVVGYRVIASDASAYDALYLCPAGFDPADFDEPTDPAAASCLPIVDGVDGTTAYDVRDIEADPANPIWDSTGENGDTIARFFVADGARIWDEDLDTCANWREDATVLVVTVRHSSSGWSFNVWDSDPASAPGTPVWLATGPTYFVETFDGCLRDGGGDTYGNLVPPNPNSYQENVDISTIAIDEEGKWIFAFYPTGIMGARWGCASVFRAPLPTRSTFPDGMSLGWKPFQEYTEDSVNADDMSPHLTTGHAADRRAHVNPMGAYLEDEPNLETLAGTYVHDATFVPGARQSLLMGSAMVWWVFEDGHTAFGDTSGVGWNSMEVFTVPPALDQAAFVLAFAGADSEPVLQDLTAPAVAACPGCTTGELQTPHDRILGGGAGDFKYANLYGEDAGWQEPADRPCEFHMMTSSIKDIEVWVDRSGDTEDAQGWAMISPQTLTGKVARGYPVVTDPGLGRAIFFSEQVGIGAAELGEEWCWDGVASGGTAGFVSGPAYLKEGTQWDLTCTDSNLLTGAIHGFPACAGGVEPRQMSAGMPLALEVVGRDTAVFTASPARPNDVELHTNDADLGGLWVVTHNPALGLTYDEVAFVDYWNDESSSTCTKADLFEFSDTFRAWPDVTVHPDSSALAGEPVRAFVSSRAGACGVAEVTWDRGSEGAATWTPVDISGCGMLDTGALGTYAINGITASRDGRWLFVWGGGNDPTVTTTAVCAVDLLGGSAKPLFTVDMFPVAFAAMSSHPHLADTWYLGGYNTPTHDDSKPGGIWALQRRQRWDASVSSWEDQWGLTRVGDGALQHRAVADIDLGPGAGGRYDPIRAFYVATSGGGWWDGQTSW